MPGTTNRSARPEGAEDDSSAERSQADVEIARWVAQAQARSLENLPALSAFQRRMDQYPQLSATAQADLHLAYRAGQAAEAALARGGLSSREERKAHDAVRKGKKAQDYLVGSNWKLVILISRENLERRYGRERVNDMLSDMVGEALTALAQAVVDYDPERCPTFSTYAARRIRDHVHMTISRDGPLRLYTSWNRLKRIAAVRMPQLATSLGRPPTRAEVQEDLLAACLDWAEKRLGPDEMVLPPDKRRALAMDKLRKQGMLGAIRDLDDVMVATQTVASLDAPVSDGSSPSIADRYSSGEENFTAGIEHQELHDDIMAALATLPERERQILLCRFGFIDGDNWTYARIAQQHGVTPERIRQIERQVLARLVTPHGQTGSLASHLPGQFDSEEP